MYKEAAKIINDADALFITAGAGIGVDSGLPDFRGNSGFWRAYPALKGLSFAEMANQEWFEKDPSKAWGFYGHRLNLYRETIPHKGFSIMLEWLNKKNNPSFVFTSNVDGQFQKAGFDKNQICECHGSIHHVQEDNDYGKIMSAKDINIEIDEETIRAKSLPSHPLLNGMIRPNILMFNDWNWNPRRTNNQEIKMQKWKINAKNKKIAIIEVGAGTAIPSVRWQSECMLEENQNASLIRINPRESWIPSQRAISIKKSGLEALEGIKNELLRNITI